MYFDDANSKSPSSSSESLYFASLTIADIALANLLRLLIGEFFLIGEKLPLWEVANVVLILLKAL